MGRRSGLVCRRGQVISPRLHELAAFVKEVAAPVGGFDLVFDSVGEGLFCHFRGKSGGFGGPVSKSGAPAVGHGGDVQAAHGLEHGGIRQGAPRAPAAGEQVGGALQADQ